MPTKSQRLAKAGLARPFHVRLLAGTALLLLGAGAARAQTAPAAPAPAAPASVTLLAPGMSAPLAFPANPLALDVGPLGKWYVDGALTGLGLVQSNPLAVDNGGQADLSNGQIFLQKLDGLVQFYVQAGGYSFPTIGTPYVPVRHAVDDYFGLVPQAFLKLVPTASFSIEAGKLPTLIGAESGFTFENMNIERGLLWNQEPVVSRGVQVSDTLNTVTVNLSLNDGYYSNVYNWVSGSLVWAMNGASTLTIDGGGNLGHTALSSFATPLVQNNSSIYNIIYTYSHGPWTITPYVQVSHVDTNPQLGILHAADSYGGALLANYTIDPHWSVAGRVEYLSTNGTPADGAPNLLYGPGSNAVSVTVTPTWQFNRFFVRAELSYVSASSVTAGDGFGRTGTQTDQVRGMLEGGVLF